MESSDVERAPRQRSEASVGDRRASLWKRALPILIVLVVAAAVRLCLHAPHPIVPGGNDPARFVYQAEHLLAGEGFLWRGKPCANLPPGYPVFIAALYAIQRSNDFVLAVQFVLSLASPALLFLAIRPRSRTLAWLAAMLLAVHLWSAYYCWQIMSECLGAFLVTLLCYLVSRLDAARVSQLAHLALAASIGFVVAAAVLTSPSVIILVYAVLAVALIQSRRHPTSVAAMLVAFALLMGPWQLHCWRTVGRVVPQVLDTTLHTNRGLATWQRTWMLRTMSPHRSAWGYFLWDTPGSTIDQVPERAFRSPEERTEWQHRAERWKAIGTSIPDRDKAFEPLAEERIAESPFRFHVGLPLVRSALLWLEMPNVSYARLQFVGQLSAEASSDDERAPEKLGTWQRIGVAQFSNFAFLIHAVFLLSALALTIGAVMSKRPMALALVLGVGGYTFVSSYLAIAEFRRNLPFIPVVLFLAYYWPRSRRAHDAHPPA